jgi:hypothetical protein
MGKLVQKVEGPFPTPQQLNKWLKQNGDNLPKVGFHAAKYKTINNCTSAPALLKTRRKTGIALINARKIRNVNVH